MKLDEVKAIATAFLKSERNAGTIKIDSVRMTESVTWVVKGNYSVVDSNRIDATFTLEINKIDKEVTAYDFKDMIRAGVA